MMKVSVVKLSIALVACMLMAFFFSTSKQKPKLVTMDDLKEANCVQVNNLSPKLPDPFSLNPEDVESAKVLIVESQGKSKDRVDLDAGYGVIQLRHMDKDGLHLVGAYYFQWSSTEPNPVSPLSKLIDSIRAKKETLTTVSMRVEGMSEKEIAKFKKENGQN